MDLMSTNDLLLECVRASVLIVLLAMLFLRGKLTLLADHPGWKQILAGFILITLATILDITDEIPGLEKFVVIGDTPTEAFLEKLPGYLLGFVLVLVGFYKMIPSLQKAKADEEELARHKENLELLVEERTRELEQAQNELLQKERLATLGQLTATVSHELRNPLGTVRNAVFCVSEELEHIKSENIQHMLSLAERNIVRCVNITEDLLDCTRNNPLTLEATDLDAWTNELIAEQTFPEDIECVQKLACGLPVYVDREKLRQALVNLIKNASDAVLDEHSRGKSIIISTQIIGNYFEICVQDDGVGMSEENLENMFEPLFSTKGFGVGLGMVIVKNIIKQHHGEVGVSSTPGKGTTVTLRLPRNPSE